MSFAGILGAGLLGGTANAAKGIGDRIREEAKQKRASALQAQVRQDNFDVAEKQQEYDVTNAETKFATDKALLTHKGDDLTGQKDLLNFQAGIAATQQTLIASLQQDNTSFSQEGANRIKESQMKLAALLKIKDNQDLAGIQAEETNLKALIAEEVAATKVETDAVVVDQKVTTDAVVVDQKVTTDAAVADQAQIDAIALQNNGGLIRTEQQKIGYAERLKQITLTKVGEIKNFFDEKTGLVQPHERMPDMSWEPRGGTQAPDASTSKGLTLQVAYNDEGEEVKGYMNGTDFVQVGGAKAIKAETPEQARAYFTGQAKYILGGAQNSFMAAKLTDDDTKLMNQWIPEAEAAFKANPKTSLSQIVKNIMFKPWVLDDMDITDDDLSAGENQASKVSAEGKVALTPMQYARQIVTKRQPDFIKAQDKYNAFKANNRDPEPVLKMMIKMGYDPALLTTPPPK